MSDFFKLYDAIISGVDRRASVDALFFGRRWAMARCDENLGIAMSTPGESIAPMYTYSDSFFIREKAAGIKSWNLTEASIMSAACNAFYNTGERMERLSCFEPYDNYCTNGLELNGATMALIGHLSLPEKEKEKLEKLYIIERSPQPGDYPDSACDYILPRCDYVLITGSALINKTLPHLLELSKNAYTVLTGPSVPMCPELLDFGIDRLAGMIVDKSKEMAEQVHSGVDGSPYKFGKTFLLKK